MHAEISRIQRESRGADAAEGRHATRRSDTGDPDDVAVEEHPLVNGHLPCPGHARRHSAERKPDAGQDLFSALLLHRTRLAEQLADWMAQQEQVIQRHLPQAPRPEPRLEKVDLVDCAPLLPFDTSPKASVRSHSHFGLLSPQRCPSGAKSPEDLFGIVSPMSTERARDTSKSDESPARVRRRSIGSCEGGGAFSQPTSVYSLDDDDLVLKLQALEVDNCRRKTGSLSSEDIGAGSWSKLRLLAKSMVHSFQFEAFFALAIVANSILIGVEVEYMVSAGQKDPSAPFFIVQHCFTVLFLGELLMRLFVDRCSFFSTSSWAWNVFDTVVVLSAMFELAIDFIQLVSTSKVGAVGNASNLRIIRIVRTARIIRVFRITRIIRFIRALRTLIYSIVCTVKSLVWVLLLLLIITYVFGIVFTQAVFDHVQIMGNSDATGNLHEYWGSVTASMLTLFQSISDGLSWSHAIDPLSEVHTVWVVLFIVFISFVYFAVLNVVTGVFVQSAVESAQRDHDMLMQAMQADKEMHMQKIKELFKILDAKESGVFTLRQFEKHIEDESVQTYLASLELDTVDAWKLFKLLDINGDHKVGLEEFVIGSFRLKGNAKSIDLATLLYEHRWLAAKLTSFMAYMEERAGGHFNFSSYSSRSM